MPLPSGIGPEPTDRTLSAPASFYTGARDWVRGTKGDDMERLMHETRETFMTLLVASCLAAGVGGVAFYTFGPEGWLVGMLRELLLDPNMGALISLLAVMAVISIGKGWLDRNSRPMLNNLLVGVVGLGGFVILLQGLRAVVS